MFEPFLDAQEPVYAGVLAELAAGDKQSHWMWFVFPQLGALGRSATAIRFGLAGLAEARAYAAHPVLGECLRACTRLMLEIEGKSARAILHTPDDLKLRSSMTLFWRATGEPLFREALEKYYGGEEDPLTLAALENND
jgi:uncharacterized protein (DUF1810 family)